MIELPWKISRQDFALLAFLISSLLAIFIINQETIPAGGGFGYDGVTYARMVLELDKIISNGELSAYYAQRILPSLLVRSVLIVFGFPLDPSNIIGAFRILNGILIIIGLGLWVAIAQHIRLTRGAFWIGVLGLFLIFPNAKQIFYYPVLTDTFAFTIGLLMVWAHLSNRPILVAVAALVGSFCWQMAGTVGIALVASTLVTAGPLDGARVEKIGDRLVKINLLLWALLGLSIGLPHVLGLDLELALFERNLPSDPFVHLLTNIPVLALVGCFLAYLLACCIAVRWGIELSIKKWSVVILLCASIVIIPKIIFIMIVNPNLAAPGFTGGLGIDQVILIMRKMFVEFARVGFVFLPVVSHAVYYGPVFLLLLLFWRYVGRMAVELGAGFVFVIATYAIVSIFPEPRFVFLLWPFVVTVVCKVVGGIGLSRPSYALLIVGAVGFSKIWLKINQGPWPMPDYALLYEWPKSVYFSSLGLWMSWNNYVVQGLIACALLVLIGLTDRFTRSSHPVVVRR